MLLKKCSCCKEIKEVSEFHKNVSIDDGYHPQCKPCKGKWYQNLPDKQKYNSESYKRRDKKHHSTSMRRWRQNNTHLTTLYSQRHNKRLKQATPLWCKLPDIVIIYEKCREFSIKFNRNFQVDHVIPLAGVKVCGLNLPENLQLLDQELNQQKSNKFPWEYKD